MSRRRGRSSSYVSPDHNFFSLSILSGLLRGPEVKSLVVRFHGGKKGIWESYKDRDVYIYVCLTSLSSRCAVSITPALRHGRLKTWQDEGFTDFSFQG
jgi:hypothetical protein